MMKMRFILVLFILLSVQGFSSPVQAEPFQSLLIPVTLVENEKLRGIDTAFGKKLISMLAPQTFLDNDNRSKERSAFRRGLAGWLRAKCPYCSYMLKSPPIQPIRQEIKTKLNDRKGDKRTEWGAF